MSARPDPLAALRSDAILARAHRITQARLSSHPQDATLRAMDEWRRSEAARADIAALVEAMRQIESMPPGQMMVDGRAKVGEARAGYGYQLIARAALAPFGDSK